MAYITKEETKVIREAIKKEFPTKKGFKFSICKRDSSVLEIGILKAPYKFKGNERHNGGMVTCRHLSNMDDEKYTTEELTFLNRIIELSNKENHDNSDTMTDYFDVGYYFRLYLGDWTNLFEYTGKKETKVTSVESVKQKPFLNRYFEAISEPIKNDEPFKSSLDILMDVMIEEENKVPENVNGLVITNVVVVPIHKPDSIDIAKARIVLNDIMVFNGLSIQNGIDGLFVAYPDNNDTQPYFPLTNQLREYVEQEILNEYQKEVA